MPNGREELYLVFNADRVAHPTTATEHGHTATGGGVGCPRKQHSSADVQ